MKKSAWLVLLLLLCAAVLGACAAAENTAGPAPAEPGKTQERTDAGLGDGSGDEREAEYRAMEMKIGETPVAVEWEDNEAVEALAELAEEGLTIQLSMYGGFEQVGSLGRELPRQDVKITTGAGDVVLYSGNQIVVFYGTNSWAYTRLGHISDKSPQELTELLGNGDVEITIQKGP